MPPTYEPPKLTPPDKFRKRISFFYIGVFVLAGITLSALQPTPIDTAAFDIDLLLKVMGPLIAISAFMERALEVLVTALRGGESARLEQEAESETDVELKEKFTHIRDEYQHRSRRIAFVTAVSAGVIISTLGIRSLEPLLVAGAFADVSAWQVGWFRFIDVVITAALLGGGSDGIHKVVKLLTDYLDEASKNIRSEGRKSREKTDDT
jgi:hypothetical protein